jgi:hypothetical protein
MNESTGEPHNPLRTQLRGRTCACINTYIHQNGGGGFNLLQCHYLQAKSYVKVQFSDKVADISILDKTQRMIHLLCAVLQVMSYSL